MVRYRRASMRRRISRSYNGFPDDSSSTGNSSSPWGGTAGLTRPPPRRSASNQPCSPVVSEWIGCRLDWASIDTRDRAGSMTNLVTRYISRILR